MKILYHNKAQEDILSLSEEEMLFKKLYMSNVAELSVTASRYVGSESAEDLVQELFIKIWDKKLFLIIPPSEFRYFLFSSIKNSCLDLLRHEVVKQDYEDYYKKQLLVEELESENTYFNDFENDDERIEQIFKEINKLPITCREIFREAYINGKKASEIAEERSISKRTVEAQLYKALKFLRESLGVSVLSILF